MPLLEPDGVAEPLRRVRELRCRPGGHRATIRSDSASAITFSFSWAASSLRRPAFSSSTSSSSASTLLTVWIAACQTLRSVQSGTLTSQASTMATQM